jgi:hypothetical protein
MLKTLRPWLISLMLHAVLAIGFVFFKTTPRPLKPQFEVELRQENLSPPSPSGIAANNVRRSSRSSKSKTKSLNFKDLLKLDSNSTPSLEDADPSLSTADSNNKPLGFAEVVELTPLLENLHRKIDERLNFPQELLDQSKNTSFLVTLVLNPDGTLNSAVAPHDPPKALEAWVLFRIREALAKPVSKSLRRGKVVTVQAEFHFEHPIRGLERPQTYLPVQGEVLVFSRYQYDEAISLSAHTIGLDDSTSSTSPYAVPMASLELIALYERLFGKQKADPARAQWDINYRLMESIRACETQNAEGACFISGQIEEVFGHLANARSWYERACNIGYNPACQALAHLKSRGKSTVDRT